MSMLDELKDHYYKTLAPENLFKIDEESPKVDNKLKEQYYTVTAKCLYFSQRSRSDI